MLDLIFLTYYVGAHVNAWRLTEQSAEDIVASDEAEWRVIMGIVAVSLIWPFYWAVRFFDGVHTKLLPGPGETA